MMKAVQLWNSLGEYDLPGTPLAAEREGGMFLNQSINQ